METAGSQYPNAYTRPVLLTSQASTPAMAQVLALPELLREILEHLPFQDLFTSSRACGEFKDTIQDTKCLREKLECETHKRVRWRYTSIGGQSYHASVPMGEGAKVVEENWLLCPLLSWKQRRTAPRTCLPEIQFDVERYLADPETWPPVYIVSVPYYWPGITVHLAFSVRSSQGRVNTVSGSSGTIEYPYRLTIGQLMDDVMASRQVYISNWDFLDLQIHRRETTSGSEHDLGWAIRKVEEETGEKAQPVEGRCFVTFD